MIQNKISLKPLLKYRQLFFSFTTAFIILSICSKSSFLYPFNDWVDSNCYFTVGKGMMNGLVVYRDLFEQKGILLYFLHGIAYLISHTTFTGVFIIEVLAGTVYLYYSAATIKLFLREKWIYLLLPLLAGVTYSSAFFAHGDSAEELSMPFLAAGLYSFFKFFTEKKLPVRKVFVINGVLAGCVLWIKYTMLGFWLAWMIALFIGIILLKQPKKAFQYCLYFAGGMALATLPWFIYFAANGALYDWYHAYFYLNITAYARFTGLLNVLLIPLNIIYRNITGMPVLLAFIITSLIGFIFTGKLINGVWTKISFLLLYVMLGIGMYCGGRTYIYYFLIFMAIALTPGLIAAVSAVSWALRKLSEAINKPSDKTFFKKLPRIFFVAACIAVFALSPVYAYFNYQYRDSMVINKNDLAQYCFADVMNRTEDPTLLNYGFLDGGFYTVAEITPSTRYFCNLNINLPEMTEAQKDVIKNKKVKFVVLRTISKGGSYGSDVPYLLQNYSLIETKDQEFEHIDFTYCLFIIKTDTDVE